MSTVTPRANLASKYVQIKKKINKKIEHFAAMVPDRFLHF